MDIIKRVNLYSVAVVIFLIGIVSFGFQSAKAIREADYKHTLTHEITRKTLVLSSLTMDYFLQVKDEKQFKEWNREYNSITELLNTDIFNGNEHSLQVFNKIKKDTLVLKESFDNLILFNNGTRTSGTLFVKAETDFYDTYFVKSGQIEQLSALFGEIANDAVNLNDVGKQELTKTIRATIVYGVISFLITLVIGLIGARSLIKNITQKRIQYVEDIKK